MRKRLEPAPERRVRREDGVLFPAGGAVVEVTPFWRRRLRDGDVVESVVKPTAPMEVSDKSGRKTK